VASPDVPAVISTNHHQQQIERDSAMNAPQPQFQTHGSAMASVAPSQGGALFTRAQNFLSGLTGKAFTFAVVLIAAEYVLPEPYKPSTRIGFFHGSIEANDTDAKRIAVVETLRRQTETQTVPQMELDAFQRQQQIVAQSLETQAAIANFTDLLCAVGSAIPAETVPRDYRDTVGAALNLGRSACGVSDGIRENMVDQMKSAGQRGSTLFKRPNAEPDKTPAAPAKPPAANEPARQQPTAPRLRIAPLQP
jgi:hypothetical protein